MKNELKIFTNEQFGEVRTLREDGKILFCGNDCAKALGYKKPNDAILRHCRATVKRSTPISGKVQEVNFIHEGDLYRLIVNSKLPSAENFESWVFDEVLPAVHKHGAYMTPEKIEDILLDPDTIISLAQELKDERALRNRLQDKVEQDMPKVIFADAVSVSHNSILIGDLAKILRQNGVEIGQNRLFKWMRDNGYLIKRNGENYNMPMQQYMEMGLFEIKESATANPDGSIRVNKTTKVTGKGQQYFINKFLTEVA